MPANPREDLRPKLERARKTLDEALSQACGSNVDNADTGELIRIEEVLAIANEAAKEAISVRRRLAGEGGDEAPRTPSPADDGAAPGHREIDDARGVRWVAFAVHPSRVAGSRATLHDRYQDGWLAFDSGTETRRIAPIPHGWSRLSEHDLRQLCEMAEPVPRRMKDRPSST